jgi:hypothetical protein
VQVINQREEFFKLRGQKLNNISSKSTNLGAR